MVGSRDQITFTLNDNGNSFTGEGTWGINSQLSGADWNNEKQSSDLPELISHTSIGTWSEYPIL
ncbi:MAG: hypothetical protein AAGI69_28580 [Cyanobacteria bacterium P01_H01_bin.21]